MWENPHREKSGREQSESVARAHRRANPISSLFHALLQDFLDCPNFRAGITFET